MNPTEGNQPALRLAPNGKQMLFYIVLTLSLFLSIWFVPLAGFLTGILTPLPSTLALIRFGYPAAIVVPGVSGVAGTLVLLMLDNAQSIPYFAALLGMGTVMGYGIGKLWPSEKVIGLSSLVVISLAAFLLALAYIETGGDLIRLLEEDLRKAVSATLSQFAASSPEARELESSLLATVPVMVRIMPGLVASCALGISWLNMLFARRYCRATALHECIGENLTLWRAPERLVWVVIISGLALLAPFLPLRFPALNLLVIAGSIYFLQGLAIASFFLEKWKVPVFFRALIYALLSMQQIASMATAVLGLFDMWFDFRKIEKQPE